MKYLLLFILCWCLRLPSEEYAKCFNVNWGQMFVGRERKQASPESAFSWHVRAVVITHGGNTMLQSFEIPMGLITQGFYQIHGQKEVITVIFSKLSCGYHQNTFWTWKFIASSASVPEQRWSSNTVKLLAVIKRIKREAVGALIAVGKYPGFDSPVYTLRDSPALESSRQSSTCDNL